MSTSTISSGITADEFQALEQKVLRAVEIVKKEREARAAAEAEIASGRQELASDAVEHASQREQLVIYIQNTRIVEAELSSLTKERDQVRVRVEKMLQQI